MQLLETLLVEEGEDADGLKGFFMNTSNYFKYGAVLDEKANDMEYFSGKVTKPYLLIDKQAQLDDIKKVGFYSDFHAHEKDIQKYKGDTLLLIRDHNRVHGDNFAWCMTKKSFDEWQEIIKECVEKVHVAYQEEWEAAQNAAMGGRRRGRRR